MKNLLIIARYNENIDWLENINSDVIVYNKGEKLDDKYNAIPVENIGRDSETFLRGICENYNIINEHYDQVSFLQAHPFDHCKDALDLLPTDSNNIIYKYPKFITGNNSMWFYKKTEGYCFDLTTNKLIHRGTDHELYNQIVQEVLNAIDLPYYDFHIESSSCQFIAPKKYIVSKSHDWWKRVHEVFLYCEKERYKDINYPGMGYVFEKLWYTILTYY